MLSRKITGHRADRPPKLCTVCRKKLQSEMIKDGVKWKDRDKVRANYCCCERCLCNIVSGDRNPNVCDTCKVKDNAKQTEEESKGTDG